MLYTTQSESTTPSINYFNPQIHTSVSLKNYIGKCKVNKNYFGKDKLQWFARPLCNKQLNYTFKIQH